MGRNGMEQMRECRVCSQRLEWCSYTKEFALTMDLLHICKRKTYRTTSQELQPQMQDINSFPLDTFLPISFLFYGSITFDKHTESLWFLSECANIVKMR